MKAIQIQRTGGPEVMELAEVAAPQPKSNEVVVQIKAAGVNFIDVYNREGRYKAPLPLVLGQEGAGVVLALGADLLEGKSEFAVGRSGRVHINFGKLCGVCGGSGGPTGEDSGGCDGGAGCGGDAAGDDGALLDSRHPSSKEGRDGADSRGGRWSGITAGTDGTQHWGAGDRHGFNRRKSGVGARCGSGRRHPLYASGFRGGDEPAEREGSASTLFMTRLERRPSKRGSMCCVRGE